MVPSWFMVTPGGRPTAVHVAGLGKEDMATSTAPPASTAMPLRMRSALAEMVVTGKASMIVSLRDAEAVVLSLVRVAVRATSAKPVPVGVPTRNDSSGPTPEAHVAGTFSMPKPAGAPEAMAHVQRCVAARGMRA